MNAENDIHVATARSGYKIFSYMTDDHEQLLSRLERLSADDHFDAWAVFQRLAVHARRKHGEGSEDYQRFQKHIVAHSTHLTDEIIVGIKKSLALKTSIDLMRFAAKLSEDVLVE